MTDKTKHLFLLLIVGVVFVWSAIQPHDYFTWFLEVSPAVIAFVIVALTYNRFRLSNLSYALIALHAIILCIGGHYTYAREPLFNWLRDIGVFHRNNYDRVGHFAQGLIPAILILEVLLRKFSFRRGMLLSFLIVCVCLATSAFYEMIEWWVSVAVGSLGDSFLGTQGYVWDTQSDMFMAMIGAVAAVVLLGKIHDASMKKH